MEFVNKLFQVILDFIVSASEIKHDKDQRPKEEKTHSNSKNSPLCKILNLTGNRTHLILKLRAENLLKIHVSYNNEFICNSVSTNWISNSK